MFYRWLLMLKKPENNLWTMPALGAVLAVLFALIAKAATVWLPENVLPEIDAPTLESLLDVVASSMLAVSTFSLSIMVSAFASASGNATPRATALVMGDSNTRMAVASFISAFIYAIIARTAMGLGYYGQNGRFMLFVSTVLVLCYLIVTLIRWVGTLSKLGFLGNTLQKIYDAADQSLNEYYRAPDLGAGWQGEAGVGAFELKAGRSGYLTHINMAALQDFAESNGCRIQIMVRPGTLLMPDTLLARIEVEAAQPDIRGGQTDTLADCFIADSARNYAQDPEWGFTVISEVAQRALSPAVNDPGTAVSVLVYLLRLSTGKRPDAQESLYDRLSIVPEDCGGWIRNSFTPIARDGAGIVEVGIVLQKVLAGISRNASRADIAAAARETARQALQRAEQALVAEADKETLRRYHRELFD